MGTPTIHWQDAMTLEEWKQKVAGVENRFAGEPFVHLHTVERGARPLQIALTERLRHRARRERRWKSVPFLTALKNVEYGFDETKARSLGGADGIFLLDRGFAPRNEMVRKLFDRYLDRPGSGVDEVAATLGARREQLLAARVVSHHMRLLGVLWRGPSADWLVLVDLDDS